MEELRSTDVLDKEIRADARKKAERILNKAEESCNDLLAGVEEKVSKASASAESAMENSLAIYKKNVYASLPLEKQRYFISYIHTSVIEAMNSYFETLGAEKRLEIIQTIVERSKLQLLGHKFEAIAVGINVKSAEKMLKKVLGSSILFCTEGNVVLFSGETVIGFNYHEGIILKADDKSMVCRLTLDEKIKEIMDSHNSELSSALFNGRLPE